MAGAVRRADMDGGIDVLTLALTRNLGASAAEAAGRAEDAAEAAEQAAESVETATVAETKEYLGII